MHPSLKDTLIFSNYCWESTSQRIRYIVLSLVNKQRVFYVEPPVLGMTSYSKLNEFYSPDGVVVLTPYLPLNTQQSERDKITEELLENFIAQENVNYFESWYFSAEPWDYSSHLDHQRIIYNIEHRSELESPLADQAHYIFSSQRIDDDRCIHIANGVDYEHFSQARLSLIKPDDLASLPSPRVGCYGIYDHELIAELVTKRPDLHFIFITQEGPLEMENVHYLGPKNFFSLPLYLSHWDIAITADRDHHMLELLASGTPVVFVNEGEELDLDLVHQASNVDDILFKIDLALQQNRLDPYWIDRVDTYLQNKSWDHQVELMLQGQQIEIDEFGTPMSLTQ